MDNFTFSVCKQCGGKGYYHMMYKAETINDPQNMMMFCSCEEGRQLRNITIDFRLADMKSMANEILPRLERAHKQLHNPAEAGKEISALQKEIRELIQKVEESSKRERQ